MEPLYADVRAYCSYLSVYCKEGMSLVLSSMTPSFFTFLCFVWGLNTKLRESHHVLTKQNIGERYFQHQPHHGLMGNPNIASMLL